MLESDHQVADLKVLSGNGPRAAVRELCKQFACATGHAVELQLDVNPEVVRRAVAGEAFDVAVGNPSTIEQLIASGKVVAGSRADIGHSGLAVAVRAGTAKPDISSVEAFKCTLLAANAVAFPAHGASGLYFVSLLDRMGIKAEMQSKLKPMAAEDTVEVVARGEADMVVVVATRIVGVAGVDVAGPIPQALQTKIGFAAGLSAATKQPDTAKALLAFLSAPAAAATLRENGVEPAH
jgi:molybdate transport system substrate-binding protein